MKSFLKKSLSLPPQSITLGILFVAMIVLGVQSIANASGTYNGNDFTTSGNESCYTHSDGTGGTSTCSGGGSTSSNEGSACWSAPNACGATQGGTIVSGVCQVTYQSGTDGKGNPTYGYYPVSTPANPAGYGVACNSPANSCGGTTAGYINCSGTCSVSSAPANPAGLGTTCTAANVCGTTATGAYICNGTTGTKCSVNAPALPTGYGNACQSAANACGTTASGTINCSSSCSAAVPALPVGYGNACQSAANICGMQNSGVIQCSGSCSASRPGDNLCAPDATISLKASPLLVKGGNTSSITWTSTNATSCTVTGTNGDSWSGTSGTHVTTAIVAQTTYTLTCASVNTKAVTPATAKIDLAPAFHEI